MLEPRRRRTHHAAQRTPTTTRCSSGRERRAGLLDVDRTRADLGPRPGRCPPRRDHPGAAAGSAEQWRRGRLDISDEHSATTVAQRLIARLGPRFDATRGGRRARSCSGASPASTTQWRARCSPISSGADASPWSTWAATRRRRRSWPRPVPRTDRVPCSSARSAKAGTPRSRRRWPRCATADLGVPLLAGGAGIAGLEAARAFGADGWTGHDGRAAIGRSRGR